MKYYHIRVNPKNGMILKHFWCALNIFNTFWEVGQCYLNGVTEEGLTLKKVQEGLHVDGGVV